MAEHHSLSHTFIGSNEGSHSTQAEAVTVDRRHTQYNNGTALPPYTPWLNTVRLLSLHRAFVQLGPLSQAIRAAACLSLGKNITAKSVHLTYRSILRR